MFGGVDAWRWWRNITHAFISPTFDCETELRVYLLSCRGVGGESGDFWSARQVSDSICNWCDPCILMFWVPAGPSQANIKYLNYHLPLSKMHNRTCKEDVWSKHVLQSKFGRKRHARKESSSDAKRNASAQIAVNKPVHLKCLADEQCMCYFTQMSFLCHHAKAAHNSFVKFAYTNIEQTKLPAGQFSFHLPTNIAWNTKVVNDFERSCILLPALLPPEERQLSLTQLLLKRVRAANRAPSQPRHSSKQAKVPPDAIREFHGPDNHTR